MGQLFCLRASPGLWMLVQAKQNERQYDFIWECPKKGTTGEYENVTLQKRPITMESRCVLRVSRHTHMEPNTQHLFIAKGPVTSSTSFVVVPVLDTSLALFHEDLFRLRLA